MLISYLPNRGDSYARSPREGAPDAGTRPRLNATMGALCVPGPVPRAREASPRRDDPRARGLHGIPGLRFTRDRYGKPYAPPTGPEHRGGCADLQGGPRRRRDVRTLEKGRLRTLILEHAQQGYRRGPPGLRRSSP